MDPAKIRESVSEYNKQAIELLTSKNHQKAYSLLKKAEEFLEFLDPDDRLHAITFNNLGCFYKTVQKSILALDMFEKSLQLNNFDKALKAGTHLNVSSILSVFNNHKKALNHATTAFNLLKNLNTTDPNLTTSLIFAGFITGKAHEQLNDLKQAEISYNRSLEIALENDSDAYIEKINLALLSIRKKKQLSAKPRYASSPRSSELPTIRSNNSEFIKQYISSEDKRRASPKHFNYPPILDIPYQKSHYTTVSTPGHRKNNTNISQIKKELMEYEEKFRRITGNKKALKLRTTTRQQYLPKVPVKPQVIEKKAEPITSPNRVDLRKVAVIIQKHWRGYCARKLWRQERRKIAHQKAKEAIAELEILKIQAKNDELYVTGDQWRPKTYSKIKGVKVDKLYKTMGKFVDKSEYNFTQRVKIIEIQAAIRRFLAVKRYKKMQKSARMIQRNVRRHQCSRLFVKIISAILFIQYQWRKFKSRKNRIN